MKRIGLFLLVAALSTGASAQKSKVLAIFQMIDAKKYEEAKEAIELAVWNDKTARWPRTYYAKGVLCQTAYEEGYKKKNSKLTGLYPDQLYVAYRAYERALELDARERLHTLIRQRYYNLGNDFSTLGEDHFRKREYEKALRAFEHALLVRNSPLIRAKMDTGLVYNTALAAYESENWDKAIGYLTGLHEDKYDPTTSLLLFEAYMATGDSVRAEEVLLEAAEIYDYDEQVVIYLINLFTRTNRLDLAIKILDDAIDNRPEHYRFLWGKGLIQRRMGIYDEAIESFLAAAELAPHEAKIYYHLGVIYYNIGIDLQEASLNIKDIARYHELREQSREKFLEAVKWLEQSYELDPSDEKTISRLSQLYYQLQMKEKEKSLKLPID